MKMHLIQHHRCIQIIMYKIILNGFILKGNNYENVSNPTSPVKTTGQNYFKYIFNNYTDTCTYFKISK